MEARLIGVETRDTFLFSGHANDRFAFLLSWQGYEIAKIDTGYRHRNPGGAGEPREWIQGPHIHYFVPGYGISYARPTDQYSWDDVNGALQFFARYCNIVSIPPVQEALIFG